MADRGAQPLYIAAAGDKTTGGAYSSAVLHTININKVAASAVLTVYDGTSTTGTKIATIDCASTGPIGTLIYDIRCANGVYAVMTGGNADVTISVF